MKHSAEARWNELHNARTVFIKRCEQYANYTIPKICPPDGYTADTYEYQQDVNSVGAQAVRHIVNKLMLTLYAPSRPSLRLVLTPEARKEIQQALGIDPEIESADMMSSIEREAWAGIDMYALRPKLFSGLTHLVVTGNVCQDLSSDSPRYIGVKDYVVRRSKTGRWLETIIRDIVVGDELAEDVREFVPNCNPEATYKVYRWYQWDGKVYKLSYWVDSIRVDLPKYSGQYKEQDVPVQPLTWDLVDGNNYGTGMIEDYKGDFAALSALSKALIEAAILASEFRWLCDPQGITKPKDLQKSVNGAAVPGRQGDIHLVNAGVVNSIGPTQEVLVDYINRIGRGFLLQSAVTRNAERVTAEEIRMQAYELETSLGGAYSRLAVDMQKPLGYWLLDHSGLSIKSSRVTQLQIITGLDALSRASDLENLKAFIMDVSNVAALPPQVLQVLNLQAIFKALAAGRGITASSYLQDAQQQQPQPTEEEPQ